MSYVLIVGAKSDIARAVARKYAETGHDLYLAARNSRELADFARDIEVRYGRRAELKELDILDYAGHRDFYAALAEKPLGVVSAVGYLGDQKQAAGDFSETRKIIATNYTGVVSLFNIMAEDFARRREGFLVGISSVAGDRGRQSNYLYGSAKAALTTYLAGLRNHLHPAGVQVLTVKPGFVATRMTAGLELPPLLTARPEEVAADIYRAQTTGRSVLYTRWYWKWIMLIIRMIPEGLFQKLKL